ncbi:aminodeoxychorismate synthase [Priestia megaterium]
MKTLIIDNYDSYTYNLYQMISEVNCEEATVIKNDELNLEDIKFGKFDNIVISPGPGSPTDKKYFGVCDEILLNAKIPVLGVCLGHQGFGFVYGASIIHAKEVVHGIASNIFHNNDFLFKDIPQEFSAVRYHSLIVDEQLPVELKKIAWTDDGTIMAMRHENKPIWGVQFHPESILTEYGYQIFRNFKDITEKYNKSSLKKVKKIDQAKQIEHGEMKSSEYKVYFEKIDMFYDTEIVFTNIFKEEENVFWLDSSKVEKGLSRFSFMGSASGPLSEVVEYNVQSDKTTVIKQGQSRVINTNIFDYLDQKINAFNISSIEVPFDFNCGFVGYFGYELKRNLGSTCKHNSVLPDSKFIFSDRFIAFDHIESKTYLVCLTQSKDKEHCREWFKEIKAKLKSLELFKFNRMPKEHFVNFKLNKSYDSYIKDIRKIKSYLIKGESYEVCLTNEIVTNTVCDPLELYLNLRHMNPAPYSALFNFNDFSVLSSSPERFLRVERDGWIEAKPIKGTISRGKDSVEDQYLKKILQEDEKSCSENLMIVDLLRNDLGRVSKLGSVQVPNLMHIETYETVHQLVSTIRSQLQDHVTSLECIKSAFPGGSMTGAPKIRTMEIIDELEGRARGIYSGSLGFLSLNKTVDLNIVIRSIISTPSYSSIGTGGAIVMNSVPDQEYEEILLKAKVLMDSIVLTATGSISEENYSLLGAKECACE